MSDRKGVICRAVNGRRYDRVIVTDGRTWHAIPRAVVDARLLLVVESGLIIG